MFINKKTHSKKTALIVIGSVLLLFIVLRLLLSSILVTALNEKLEKDYAKLKFHVDNITIRIVMGEYSFNGITGKIKSTKEKFMDIKVMTLKVHWLDVIRTKIVGNAFIEEAKLNLSPQIIAAIKDEESGQSKKRKNAKKNKNPWIRINSLIVQDADINLKGYTIHGEQNISDINLEVSNLAPTVKNPQTLFNLSASLLGPSPIRAVGSMDTTKRTIEWDLNFEMKNFNLKNFDPIAREQMRGKITDGTLDLYGEMRSIGGQIEGYIKPFINQARIHPLNKKFKFKGEKADNLEKIMNVAWDKKNKKSLATKIPFTFDKKLKIDVLPALVKALKDKNDKNAVKPGVEDTIGEAGLGMSELKQAQEEK